MWRQSKPSKLVIAFCWMSLGIVSLVLPVNANEKDAHAETKTVHASSSTGDTHANTGHDDTKTAHANSNTTDTHANTGPKEKLCGVLETFSGDVQVLNESRTSLINMGLRTPIPCGAWISVGMGWAELKHREGPRIRFSNFSLAQLVKLDEKAETKDDHLLLLKGELLAHVENGSGEFRLVTSSGRARIENGEALLVYKADEDETQLLSLSKTASLENRFEGRKKIEVRSGEMTHLNFKLLRVIPHLPQKVTLASLRLQLADLHLPSEDQERAEQAVYKRAIEKPTAPVRRSVASTGKKKGTSYLRHRPNPVTSKIRPHLLRTLAGEPSLGEQILHPKLAHERPSKARVMVQDVDWKPDPRKKREEDSEKQRLMKALSQIRED